MTPMFYVSARPARLFGLITPLVVLVGLAALLLLPNLIMHRGLSSDASPSRLMLGRDAVSQSAAATPESPPVMR